MSIILRKAYSSDIQAIHQLITPYAHEGLILERTEDEIGEFIDCFFIAQKADSIIGVVSYYDYGPALKEIRSLAVKSELKSNGIGSMLVEKITSHLGHKSSAKIFTLTYSPGFFEKNGFIEVPKESLPEKIWKDCMKCKHRETCGETAMVYAKIS